MLQDPSSVEQVHEASVRVGVEMIDDRDYFAFKCAALDIRISHSTEALPECEQNDLSFGVLAVDFVDELDVGCGVLGRGYVVSGISIVCA